MNEILRKDEIKQHDRIGKHNQFQHVLTKRVDQLKQMGTLSGILKDLLDSDDDDDGIYDGGDL